MTFHLLFLGFYNVFFFFVRVTAVTTLPLRHTPSVAMTWLLIILFWPLPGGLLYLAIGSTQLPEKRKTRHENAVARLKKDLKMWPPRKKVFFSDKLTTISRMGERLGHWPVQHARKMKFIDSTDILIGRLVEDIDSAKDHVLLMYYIFQKDQVTLPLINALKKAAARGVECYVLLDELGSKKFLKKEGPSLRKAGIHLQRALPLSRLRRTPLTARFDMRNHRKLAVIDCSTGYMGSHNIIEPTYGGKAKGREWKDLSLRVEGPIVEQLLGVFLEDWYVETNQSLIRCLSDYSEDNDLVYPLQTVPSGPSYETQNYQRLVASGLFHARKRVIITTPYLIPDEGLLQALEVACLNGATVDLIIPETPDQFLVRNAARAYYSKLMEIGIDIYLHQSEFLHAKTMTMDDDLAFFGSSNFDIRSFVLNFELNMILYGEDEIAQLRKAQEKYLADSYKLDPVEWEKRPLWAKTIHGIAKLLSPIL